MVFIVFVLQAGYCTDSDGFRGVEYLCRSGILVFLYQGVLDFVLTVGLFEVVRVCTFDIPLAYVAFCRMVVIDLEYEGNNVGQFHYTADKCIVTDISAREVPRHKLSLDDEVVSVHVDAAMISLLVDQLFILTDARDTSTTFSGLSEEVKERKKDDVEDDFEEVWDVSNLRRSIEHGQSGPERMKSFSPSLPRPVTTTVVEAPQPDQNVA